MSAQFFHLAPSTQIANLPPVAGGFEDRPGTIAHCGVVAAFVVESPQGIAPSKRPDQGCCAQIASINVSRNVFCAPGAAAAPCDHFLGLWPAARTKSPRRPSATACGFLPKYAGPGSDPVSGRQTPKHRPLTSFEWHCPQCTSSEIWHEAGGYYYLPSSG
jgi:hypothetical protein